MTSTVTRVDPRDLPGRPCPAASALDLVGERWALLAVREVLFGNHQFTEIARATGAPTDRLTVRLRDLVAAGVMERRPNPDAGGRDGYYLTRAGEELATIARALTTWGERWAVNTHRAPVRHHGHVIKPHTACATCGEAVDDAELLRESARSPWKDGPPRSPR